MSVWRGFGGKILVHATRGRVDQVSRNHFARDLAEGPRVHTLRLHVPHQRIELAGVFREDQRFSVLVVQYLKQCLDEKRLARSRVTLDVQVIVRVPFELEKDPALLEAERPGGTARQVDS